MTTTSSPITTFPAARGKVTAIDANLVRFAPAGTTYELHLVLENRERAESIPLNTPVDVTIRLEARKVYTVPSGGNFVTPIFGPPRIVQGRVRAATVSEIVVHAGTTFHVRLPANNSALDLNNGPIAVGSLVNVVALPGASIEI